MTDAVAEHGEGIVWHADWPGPRWVDMFAGSLLQLDARSGRISRGHLEVPIAAMVRPRRAGGIVVATGHDVRVYADVGEWGERDVTLQASWVSPVLVSGEGERLNDGCCSPDGAVLLGSTTNPRVKAGAFLYAIGAERRVSTLITGLTVANGLVFDASGESFFHVDTPARTIYRSGWGAERPLATQPWADTSEVDGWPDGACADSEGGLWVAMFGGAAVVRFDADGVLTERIELPVSRVTACGFAPGEATLWITTSSRGAEGERPRGAGAVFRADVGVLGCPVSAAAL